MRLREELLEELYPERLNGNGTDSGSRGRRNCEKELAVLPDEAVKSGNCCTSSAEAGKNRPGHGNQQGNAVAT